MKGFLRVLRLTSLLKRIQTPSSIRRYPNKIQVMNRQYLPCVHQIAHCRCNMSAVHTKGLVPVLLPSLQHVPKCLPGLRPRPHYAGEIWQLFFSTVWPTVHTNPSWKRSSGRRNLKTLALCFSVHEKQFENGAFRKRWCLNNHVINPNFQESSQAFLPLVYRYCFSGVVWTENI